MSLKARTATEEEVIILTAVKEIIDSIVNVEVLDLRGQDPNSEIVFPTSTHLKFFSIVLVDCLSKTDELAPVRKDSYLAWLRAITDRPAFDVENSIASLRAATADFVDWLEQEMEIVDAWFPSINVQTTLKLSRLSFLKMCGTISKHNFLRAIGVAEELRDVLQKNGVSVQLEDALGALPYFYEGFQTDILNYHGSTIAEFLNNIRWGIYEYLQPEFRRSIVREGGDPLKYYYTYPDDVAVPFARECYWNLMNEVRSPPYMRRFCVMKWLKLRY